MPKRIRMLAQIDAAKCTSHRLGEHACRTVQICIGTDTKTGKIDTAIIGGAHVRLSAVLASSSRLALPVIIDGLAAKTDPRNLVEAITAPLRSTLPHHH